MLWWLLVNDGFDPYPFPRDKFVQALEHFVTDLGSEIGELDQERAIAFE